MSEQKHEHKRVVWVEPCLSCGCGCEDDEEEDVYAITFEIPGVKKKDVHLHVIAEGLRLSAPRGEDATYYSEYTFSCPVDPSQTKALYDNGILTVTVPFSCPDPFKGSKPVAIV